MNGKFVKWESPKGVSPAYLRLEAPLGRVFRVPNYYLPITQDGGPTSMDTDKKYSLVEPKDGETLKDACARVRSDAEHIKAEMSEPKGDPQAPNRPDSWCGDRSAAMPIRGEAESYAAAPKGASETKWRADKVEPGKKVRSLDEILSQIKTAPAGDEWHGMKQRILKEFRTLPEAQQELVMAEIAQVLPRKSDPKAWPTPGPNICPACSAGVQLCDEDGQKRDPSSDTDAKNPDTGPELRPGVYLRIRDLETVYIYKVDSSTVVPKYLFYNFSSEEFGRTAGRIGNDFFRRIEDPVVFEQVNSKVMAMVADEAKAFERYRELGASLLREAGKQEYEKEEMLKDRQEKWAKTSHADLLASQLAKSLNKMMAPAGTTGRQFEMPEPRPYSSSEKREYEEYCASQRAFGATPMVEKDFFKDKVPAILAGDSVVSRASLGKALKCQQPRGIAAAREDGALITKEEAMELLGMDDSEMDKAVASGDIRAFRAAGKLKFTYGDAMKYRAEMEDHGRAVPSMKVHAIGNESRPATQADIEEVQRQLAQCAIDPNMTISTAMHIPEKKADPESERGDGF